MKERAMGGKGNYTSFPVFCSDLQLDMNLQDRTVQSRSIAICSCCGLNSLHLFISAARFLLGSPVCLLYPLCGMCSGIVFPEPFAFTPPSFLLTWQGRVLFPGKASPSSPFSSEPSVTSLGFLFLLLFPLLNIFLSSYGCLPFSSLSTPKLLLLQSCPIW